MTSGYSFRPRVWAALLAAAACAAFIALGNWQARRADEKRALGEQETRRVSLSGVFRPEYTVFLDNKIRNHRAGYEVVTPLLIDNDYVLVNRGWIAGGASREALPQVKTPEGQVRIEGVVRDRLPRMLNLEKGTGKVRQSLDIAEFSRETKLRLRPYFLEQHSSTADGLQRDWPSAGTSVATHRSYSLQWYSFAVLTLVLFIVLSFRRVAKT